MGEADHPRVCGNYSCIFSPAFHHPGSPPRVRELRAGRSSRPLPLRITPACAGITHFIPPFVREFQDHPRVCGNYRDKPSTRRRFTGSPPRVRELQSGCLISCSYCRITPACAGITFQHVCFRFVRQDHPRVCGNYIQLEL